MFWSKTKIWNLLKNMSRITDGIWAVSHLTCLPVFRNLLRLFWDWITQCFSLSSPIFFFFFNNIPFQLCDRMARKFSVSTVSSSSPVVSLEPVHSKLHYSIQAAVVKVAGDHPVSISPFSSDLSAFSRLRPPVLKTWASPGFLGASHSQPSLIITSCSS